MKYKANWEETKQKWEKLLETAEYWQTAYEHYCRKAGDEGFRKGSRNEV